MADLVQHPAVSALAWALFHFVWQGAAIAGAAFVAFRWVRTSASWRYAVGVGALTAMLAAPIATFVTLLNAPMPLVAVAGRTQATVDPARPGDSGSAIGTSSTATVTAPMAALALTPQALAAAVSAWLAGVAFFSLRLLGGWVVARRIARTSVRPAAAHLQALAAQVADRLALRRMVVVVESTTVAVPVIVGWLKPTVVLPIAALSGLSPAQVEALLAHELAHVRRHDYLVNLLQSVVEAVLFYHPAVWWLSRRVRMERELCCDDLAVGVCDRLVYATALSDLAAMTSPQVALAATDGDLLGRVRRILSHSDTHANTRGSIMSTFAFGLVATVAIPVALISATQMTTTSAGQTQTAHRAHAAQVAHAAQADRAKQAAEVHARATQVQHVTAEQVAQATTQVDEKRREELERAAESLKRLAAIQLDHAKELRARVIEEALAARRDQAEVTHAQRVATAATAEEQEAARRKLAEARQMFEKGLTSRTQLAEAERELELALEKLQRSRNLAEKGLTSSHVRSELELHVAQLEQRLMAQRVHEAQAASQNRSARELYELLAVHRADLRHEVAETVLGADERVRAGDTVRVAIEGEPSLPPTYTVSADGTIRIPFLGAVKVVGLTTAEARAAVGNQLSARKLGSPNQVTVTVSRPRGTGGK